MNTVSLPNELLLEETARLIAQGHTVTHRVRGNSMNPFLVDRRDKVTLSLYLDSQLRPGAFVLARTTDDRLVLHRIIRRRGNLLTLMGDGNIGQTEQTTTRDVLGLVIEVSRKGKIYRCTGRTWRTYSYLWTRLLPVRRYVLRATRVSKP